MIRHVAPLLFALFCCLLISICEALPPDGHGDGRGHFDRNGDNGRSSDRGPPNQFERGNGNGHSQNNRETGRSVNERNLDDRATGRGQGDRGNDNGRGRDGNRGFDQNQNRGGWDRDRSQGPGRDQNWDGRNFDGRGRGNEQGSRGSDNRGSSNNGRGDGDRDRDRGGGGGQSSNNNGRGRDNDHDHDRGGGGDRGSSNNGPSRDEDRNWNGGDRDGRGDGGGGGGGNGRGGGGGGGHSHERHYGGYHGNSRRIDDNDLQRLHSNCRSRNNCRGQGERSKRTRDAVKRSYTRSRHGGSWGGHDEAQVERRFQKTFEAKKAVFQLNGLSDLDPHDNGLFGGDMALNEVQAQKIIDRSKGVVDQSQVAEVPLLDVDSLPPSPLFGSRKKRADTLSLDFYRGNKWPTTTINFFVDPKDFNTAQANVIRNGLKSISAVSCLKFVEGWKFPVIEYVKAPDDTDEGTCGWSQVGYQGDYNSVNINFDSTICKSTLQGVVVHETLHALGFVHEHSRYDRDRYLKIDWTNVDPQSYDVYDKDDPHDHNPYCIDFDPLSIMQYDPYVGAIDPKKPVMTPVANAANLLPRMGQGVTMTSTDAKLLNRLYCQDHNPTCKDKSTNCGWTACSDCATFASVCPRSCGKC